MARLEEFGLVPLASVRGDLADAARGIPLRRRDGTVKAFAMVDAEDFARLGGVSWYEKSGYVRRNKPAPDGPRKQTTTVQLHREVLGLEHGDPLKVDHVNHDTLDNRRRNLRTCTHAQNHQNRRAHGDSATSSSYRGVSWNREAKKWRAYGCLNGKLVYLGDHADELEASRIASEWRSEHMPFTTN